MDRFAASVSTLTVVLVLLVAMVGHAADPGAVRRALKAHRLLPLRAAGPVAATAIGAELVLGVGGAIAVVTGIGIRPLLAGMVLLFLTYAGYSLVALNSGSGGPCGCASSAKLPLGPWVVVRALLLAALALVGLLGGGVSLHDGTEVAIAVAAAATFAVLLWQLPVAMHDPYVQRARERPRR